MFANITNEVDMTIQTVKKKIDELNNSSNWNYILIGTAFLTLIVAARNISIYLGEIKKLKAQTGNK
jgi:hypothetical protein